MNSSGSSPDDAGKAVAAHPSPRRSLTLTERWQASFFYQLLLRGVPPSTFGAQLPDAWPGNVHNGLTILSGQIPDGGRLFDAIQPPWVAAGDDQATIRLHMFDWLNDLAAVGSPETQARARDLMLGWLDASRQWHPAVWEADITSHRLIACLTHTRFWSRGADDSLTHSMLASLVRHTKHLIRTASRANPGLDAVIAGKALIYAGLSGFDDTALQRGLRLLEQEIGGQLLGDGGHIQRSPEIHLQFLAVLVDARDALALVAQPVPAWLASAIDAAAPILRLYRHADGGLALFNSTGYAKPALTDAVLRRAKAPTLPPVHAPQTGFVRLASDRAVVVMDVGTFPPAPFDHASHAGTLSFELDYGAERVIVNCGARQDAAPAWRQAQRATAAHSTLAFADTNSSETLPHGIGRQPRHVPVSCDTRDGEFWLTASHDGYRPNFGLVHRRRLYLSADGNDLRGEDTLSGRHDGRFSIRFHTHPDIQASLVQNAAAVLLRAPSGTAWRFQAANAALSLAETVYLAVPGAPRRSEQIVLSGTREGAETVVKWAFRRIDTN